MSADAGTYSRVRLIAWRVFKDMEIDMEPLLASARLAHQEGKIQDADRICRQILTKSPNDLGAKTLLGVISAQLGRAAVGIPILQAVLSADPDSFEAAYWLGMMLRSVGNISEAIQYGKRAIEIRPSDSQALFNLSICYLAAKQPELAAHHLRTAISVEPNVPLLHHVLGEALRGSAQDREAVAEYQSAISLAPNMPNSYPPLAALFISQGRADDAEELINRVVAATPDNFQSQFQLARLLFESGLREPALRGFTRSIELQPDQPGAYELRGAIYQQLGDFESACGDFQRVIELQPNNPKPYLELTACKKMKDEDRPLVDRMTSMLQSRSLPPEGRCTIHYALGKAYDDLAAYAKAMQHYDEANGMMRSQLANKAFDRRAFSMGIDQTIRTFTPGYLSRNKSMGNESDLPFLIVGMMRSGTTLIEQIVSSHPSVAAGGEQNYLLNRWGRILQPPAGSPHREAAKEVADGYLDLLQSIDPLAAHVTDKMPNNFLLLGMAHLLFPNARLIHCRRNPLDTCISIWTTYFREPVNTAHDKDTIVFFYREYLRLMEHWRTVLPSDRFLEVDYEELVMNREAVTRQLIDFCGLDWDDRCLHHESNDGVIRTPSWWQARQPVYATSIGRWKNYEPWLGEFKELLTQSSA